VKVSCFPKWAVLNLNMGISVKEWVLFKALIQRFKAKPFWT
jgi:hypothetical protein